jgi:phosphinothricin acetyltransferase
VFVIRPAELADVPAMLDIYVPYVLGTAISFEAAAPTVEEFSQRVLKARKDWAWLVAESGGEIAGYAYGSAHRERPAYRWSVETSAYVHDKFKGQGCGTKLYVALLSQLAQRGFCNAFAGVALPNEASLKLHRSAGFESIGVFKRVGRKFNAWHDVAWFHRQLRDEPVEAGDGQMPVT